jgi:hypothetical protein
MNIRNRINGIFLQYRETRERSRQDGRSEKVLHLLDGKIGKVRNAKS